MAKYTIYRDDYEYPISADTFEELQELRSQENRSFMNHYYGSVCRTYNKDTKEYEYYNIYTKERVPSSEKDW